MVLYRIFQELINNVIKHAGALTIGITLSFDEDSIKFEIMDDGVGMSEDEIKIKTDGSGLKNIRSRVTSLNGTFCINSQAIGTHIIINLPYHE